MTALHVILILFDEAAELVSALPMPVWRPDLEMRDMTMFCGEQT